MKTVSLSHASRVGIFAATIYAICLVWPLIYTYPADVAAHHLLNLKLMFPGFQGYDVGSIMWGGVLSFAYGMVASVIYKSLQEK